MHLARGPAVLNKGREGREVEDNRWMVVRLETKKADADNKSAPAF